MFAPGFIYRVKRFIIHYVHFAVKKSDKHEKNIFRVFELSCFRDNQLKFRLQYYSF
jgi:hypothetical protein